MTKRRTDSELVNMQGKLAFHFSSQMMCHDRTGDFYWIKCVSMDRDTLEPVVTYHRGGAEHEGLGHPAMFSGKLSDIMEKFSTVSEDGWAAVPRWPDEDPAAGEADTPADPENLAGRPVLIGLSAPDKHVVNLAKRLLDMAEAGDLRTLSAVGECLNGNTFTAYETSDVSTSLGGVALLQYKMARTFNGTPKKE